MTILVKIQNLPDSGAAVRLVTQTRSVDGPWANQGTETISPGSELQKTVNPTTRYIVQE